MSDDDMGRNDRAIGFLVIAGCLGWTLLVAAVVAALW